MQQATHPPTLSINCSQPCLRCAVCVQQNVEFWAVNTDAQVSVMGVRDICLNTSPAAASAVTNLGSCAQP